MVGHRCSFTNCANTSVSTPDCSFYRFPVNQNERAVEWITLSGNASLFTLAKHELYCRYACSDHFRPEQVFPSGRLFRNALPKSWLTTLDDEEHTAKDITQPNDASNVNSLKNTDKSTPNMEMDFGLWEGMTDFSRCCRLCLNIHQYNELTEIFVGASESPDSLVHKITSLIPIELRLMDDLPHGVCRSCADNLTMMHAFISTAVSVDTWLRSRVNRIEMKNEVVDSEAETVPPAEQDPLAFEQFLPSGPIEQDLPDTLLDLGDGDDIGFFDEFMNDLRATTQEIGPLKQEEFGRVANLETDSGKESSDEEYCPEDDASGSECERNGRTERSAANHLTDEQMQTSLLNFKDQKLRDGHTQSNPDGVEYESNVLDKKVEDANPAGNDIDGDGEDTGASGPRKRMRNTYNWARNVKKRKRESGQAYVDMKGNEYPPRISNGNCTKGCPFKCEAKVVNEVQLEMFNSFWRLSDERKLHFYSKYIVRTSALRKRTPVDISRRKFSYEYFFEVQGERIRVCREFFLSVLNISSRRVYYFFKHTNNLATGVALSTKKGKHVKYTISENVLDGVRKHIQTFPTVESHCCESNSTKQYLDAQLSLAQMYRLYLESEFVVNGKPVKSNKYREVFNAEFDLAFLRPKKYLCDRCLSE